MASIVYRIYKLEDRDIIHEGTPRTSYEDYSDRITILHTVTNDCDSMKVALAKIDELNENNKGCGGKPQEYTVLPVIV